MNFSADQDPLTRQNSNPIFSFNEEKWVTRVRGFRRISIVILLFLLYIPKPYAQASGFSIATDLGLQRSFKKEQQYFAGGHTTHVLFHFTPRGAIYAWIGYFTVGKFRNDLVATAKSPATIPQQVDYRNNAAMRFKHFSIGWKHYLKGRFDANDGWNLYTYGGFGLLLGRVINTHSVSIDTSSYDAPVLAGKANFKRLTLDCGLGYEIPIGAMVYFYSDGRLWIPTTDYPSKHIFVNDNAPVVAMINFGLRILF